MVYALAQDFNGNIAGSVTLSDTSLSDTGSFAINVTPVNDPPVVVDDTFGTEEDTLLTTANVLSNDSDVDGDTITVSAFHATSVQGGTVSQNGNGTFNYTPPADFNGSDSFEYTANDGNGGQATATVTINVKGPKFFVVDDKDASSAISSPATSTARSTASSSTTLTTTVIGGVTTTRCATWFLSSTSSTGRE